MLFYRTFDRTQPGSSIKERERERERIGQTVGVGKCPKGGAAPVVVVAVALIAISIAWGERWILKVRHGTVRVRYGSGGERVGHSEKTVSFYPPLSFRSL